MVFGSRGGNGRDRQYRSNNDRPSRSYNSPPVTSRVSSSRYDDRSEAPERFPDDYSRGRREETNMSSKFFSNFYRERFGSHSPEDYRNLRISQFDRSLSKNDIRVLLEQEFKSMAPFEIKIVRNPEDDERLAYVNFERDNCAKTIRRSMIPRLHRVLGRRLVLDPTGVIRDQEGKYIPDRYNRAVMAADRDRRSPPRHRRRSYSREPESRSRSRSPSNRPAVPRPSGRSREANPFANLVQDDTLATRTLFVGNLPGDVRESELRRVFDIYGKIEEVEIKVLSSNVSYAFVLYRTVEGAIEARRCQHNKPMRPGSTRCQIGYGKTQTSSRLYVGGLGSWTTLEMLMDEFDRYGAIEEVEYEPGQTSAYIRFVDIDSASDACSRMKNFELKSGKFITVDFVKGASSREKPRKRGRSSSSDDLADSKRQNLDARSWSPTSAGYIATLEDLREHFACTWKGFVTLKKVDYPLGFHRIYGKEHLLQDLLRDEAGAALKLTITQRLKLDNNYYQEIIDLPPRELALMIAIDGNPSADRVVQYLQDKGAAGLAFLDECTVNILPQSSIAERLLNFFAPRVAVLKVSPNYMLIVLRKAVKEKAKGQQIPQQDQKSEVKAGSSQPQELHPPPPPPSLRVKAEVDDDKLEQIHQERLQLRAKVKQELRSSPILDPAPAPPDLSLLGKNGGENGKASSDRRRSRRGSRSDEEEESSSSESSENGEGDDDGNENANLGDATQKPLRKKNGEGGSGRNGRKSSSESGSES